ncbi:MAG: polysaccharide deacetylase family protein, partial [Calditrichia bacterium]|nr:polysaccharide deacetylase family protein [Calditrichia bacterium]
MAQKKKRELAKQPCKNHPKRKTSRRCFQCKDYICKECQITHDHHLFCSDNCINKYNGKISGKPLPSSKSISVFSKKDIFYISAIIALIFIILIRTGYQKIHYAKSPVDSTIAAKQLKEWQPMVYQKELNLQIEPQIPDSLVVSVWVNSEYYKTIEKAREIKIPAEKLQPGENIISLLTLSEFGSKVIFRKIIPFNPKPLKHLDYIRLPGNSKRIALTFDGGSNNEAVDSIINIMKMYDIKATTFITGEFIKRFPEEIKKLLNSKCFEIGNHSYSHPRLTSYATNSKHNTLKNVNFNKINKELSKTDSVYYNLTGKHLAKFWRAPYGEYNPEILSWAGHSGYTHLGWSQGFDTFDWVKDSTSSIYYTPEQMWQKWQIRWKNEPHLFKGAIVLMHLGNDRIK